MSGSVSCDSLFEAVSLTSRFLLKGLNPHSTFFIFFLHLKKLRYLFGFTFYHWTMGGSASSQATKDGDIENRKENNFGLVNVSSDSSGTWNRDVHICRAGPVVSVIFLVSKAQS